MRNMQIVRDYAKLCDISNNMRKLLNYAKNRIIA